MEFVFLKKKKSSFKITVSIFTLYKESGTSTQRYKELQFGGGTRSQDLM